MTMLKNYPQLVYNDEVIVYFVCTNARKEHLEVKMFIAHDDRISTEGISPLSNFYRKNINNHQNYMIRERNGSIMIHECKIIKKHVLTNYFKDKLELI